MLKAGVIGATGYLGGEVIRLLLNHPGVHVTSIAGNESAGKRLKDVQPNFAGIFDDVILKEDQVDYSQLDIVFLALPTGASMQIVPKLPTHLKIIDLAADFRIKDASVYEEYYKMTPLATLPDEFVYGLPELFKPRIKEARTIAAPGCFATAAILSLYPLAQFGAIDGSVFINAVTGSSGAGKGPKETTHHPFRENSLFPYETWHHRHVPEIRQALKDKTGRDVEFVFQPHSGPFVRGILATAYVHVKKDTNAAVLFQNCYSNDPFVSLMGELPNVKWVANTNQAAISVKQEGQNVIVFTAIDNLLKGGAGQAVQCMNIMCDFSESAGLKLIPANP